MLNDLSVSAVSRISASSGVAAYEAPAKSQAAGVQPSGTPAEAAGSEAKPAGAAASATATAVSLHSSPESWFDPALGLVVLQFFNAEGVKTDSIPNQKQLDSYRMHDLQGGGTGASAVGGSPSPEGIIAASVKPDTP